MTPLLPRSLADQIRADLQRKMVFVSGPRQVGKTTLARQVLPDPAGYLSWDIPEHRDAILRGRLPAVKMLAFDELHKFHRWRAFLKGLHDRRDGTRILVTGSGRLDFYRHGGDSLQCGCTRCLSPSSASPTPRDSPGSSIWEASPNRT